MIPFAILGGRLKLSKESIEIRILDLSVDGFTFRLSHQYDRDAICKLRCIALSFFDFDAGVYENISIEDACVTVDTETNYAIIYRVVTANCDYHTQVKYLSKAYMRYIQLKQSGDDAALSAELVGYPAELDAHISGCFDRQLSGWLADGFCGDWDDWDDWDEILEMPFEMAVSIETPAFYEDYLAKDWQAFLKAYWKRCHMEKHPLSQKSVTHLYMGNSFCHLLRPETSQLLAMVARAFNDGLTPVIVYTYMQTSDCEAVFSQLSQLARWCDANDRRLELVVNDWGMASFIKTHAYDCFDVSMGVLLNKRRKDVRLPMKKGYEQMLPGLRVNAQNDLDYRLFLTEMFGIRHAYEEACGYPILQDAFNDRLMLPFYQMNTSEYCPLYAACHFGDRGHQSPVTVCPGYCSETAFLYPDHLQMVGRYNSLMGFNASVINDASVLKAYLKHGTHRIVLNL